MVTNKSLRWQATIKDQVVDLDPRKNRVIVTYHLNESEIAPIVREYDRAMLSGSFSSPADGGEVTIANPEELARQQKINQLDKDCLKNIRNAEKNMMDEFALFRDGEEEEINTLKTTNNIRDAMDKILEKSLSDKAREKQTATSNYQV